MARRRRYNPNQKRARNGQWTKGARGAALSTGAATPAGGGTYKTAKQRRYEGYQKHLAQQAEIQAANKRKNTRRAVAGAALGAAAVGAIALSGVRRSRSSITTTPVRRDDSPRVGRPESRSGSPLAMHNANIARETPSSKVNLVRNMPKAKPVKVAPGPNKMASQMAGTKAPTKPKTAQAPNKAGVQNPGTAGLPKKSGRKAKNDAPPRFTEVQIIKSQSQAKEVRERRNADIRALNEQIKKNGLGINDLSGARITDEAANRRAAAKAREAKKKDNLRAKNYADTPKTIAAEAARKAAASTRRARAEDRYASILVNARVSGKQLNRNQRKYLSDLGM